MSSSRVVRVRPRRGRRRRRRRCATASPRSSASSRSARSSRPRSRRPRRPRSRTRGCPTSTAPTCRSSPSTRAGSMDLDQALHLARTDDGGYVLHYAIADLAAFITPGDPVDLEAHRRGQTLYGADSRIPLHPTVDLRGRRLAAARPGAPGAALDDHDGRRGRAHRRPGRAGAGEEPAPSSTTRACRSRSTTAPPTSPCSCSRRSASCGSSARQARGGISLPLPGAGGRHLRRREWELSLPRPAAGRGVERADVAAHRLRRGVADDVRAGRLPAHAAAAGPARRAAAAPHRARAGHRLAGRAALPRLHPRPSTRPSRSTPR